MRTENSRARVELAGDQEHRHVGTSNCKNESDHGQENLDGLLIVFAQTLNSLRGTEGQNVFSSPLDRECPGR